MPPRLELFSALRKRHGPSYFTHNASLLRCFTSSPSPSASTVAQKRRRQDPYAAAQARALRAANLSRQEVLRTERSKALGDPVRGITTPYVESFDTAFPSGREVAGKDTPSRLPEGGQQPTPHHHLNYFVSKEELNAAIESSEKMAEPARSQNRYTNDPEFERRKAEEHKIGHQNAMEAMQRIMAIDNASSDDKTRINKQRCIETFGRHNTDKFLQPKPGVVLPEDPMVSGKTPRAGPDTGSSEVQIAILTSKIKTLADQLQLRGKKDKVNKRNLRVMVHKRQKLLSYLRRKEKGGERWQHCVKTLGLTDGTWKGEISL